MDLGRQKTRLRFTPYNLCQFTHIPAEMRPSVKACCSFLFSIGMLASASRGPRFDKVSFFKLETVECLGAFTAHQHGNNAAHGPVLAVVCAEILS
ncbi:hypothetical protein EMIHUDRAFT_195328 [Emiliania huxleyi CCMP1516]|uniref:Uncharacterized protein n=2 Tax=Emiliania huxleyi TaxID=2903 RepID=A0A0D3JHB6_EMIH1|nr:hypothetical protein EMIHUDRAFT_195328 [Emiliania huxleyi CCMP1516]EOD22901.1 hypothetical protein EMIHUDRAFT_195328 [Emiliania huxleyi CCMP1516]|eukprot:XP_005775330.1 hypothetical protein EMIHUDRAFT_195328 [Emiliania huxleyi CCMP1516]